MCAKLELNTVEYGLLVQTNAGLFTYLCVGRAVTDLNGRIDWHRADSLSVDEMP